MAPSSQKNVLHHTALAKLISQIETMVTESGDPEKRQGFDSAKFAAEWLAAPNPALAGETPGSYMDTIEGQRAVFGLLAMMQSGAYA